MSKAESAKHDAIGTRVHYVLAPGRCRIAFITEIYPIGKGHQPNADLRWLAAGMHDVGVEGAGAIEAGHGLDVGSLIGIVLNVPYSSEKKPGTWHGPDFQTKA